MGIGVLNSYLMECITFMAFVYNGLSQKKSGVHAYVKCDCTIGKVSFGQNI